LVIAGVDGSQLLSDKPQGPINNYLLGVGGLATYKIDKNKKPKENVPVINKIKKALD
jgi:hypothetical protein